MKDLKRLVYYLCFIPVIIWIPLALLLLFISMLLSMCGFEQWPDVFTEIADYPFHLHSKLEPK
jgi:uncharacterized membrane protein